MRRRITGAWWKWKTVLETWRDKSTSKDHYKNSIYDTISFGENCYNNSIYDTNENHISWFDNPKSTGGLCLDHVFMEGFKQEWKKIAKDKIELQGS